ncbi:hypothetical protein ACFFKE_09260 [Streptomyces mutabilis]|uniref:hypothetical protein n=1 Tax=Streptomyces mutabilis TaxID=67332 RepID=UPI001784DFE0|nr:hypothetical protein [Streptomyces mutabilis]GGQ23523.1 hypothetical protein GCM10010279_34120 [Streptomyces mutabilis]
MSDAELPPSNPAKPTTPPDVPDVRSTARPGGIGHWFRTSSDAERAEATHSQDITGQDGARDSFVYAPDHRLVDQTHEPPQASASYTFASPVGVVADRVDKIVNETRKRDVLDWIELDRQRLLKLEPFVKDPKWDSAWQSARAATKETRVRVLIVVAPRGCGSTTFTHQFIAREADTRFKLCRAEADWESPAVSKLPLEVGQILQIDLKDPGQDRPSTTFLKDLDGHAQKLEECKSYLVLTVAEELWRGHRAWVPDRARVVHLNDSPDPQEVIKAHLRTAGYPGLVAYAQTDKAREQIRGLNAIEAVRAASTVIRQWEELGRRRPPALLVGDGQESPLDDELRAQVENALADWRDDFDILFGDAGEGEQRGMRPLPLDDRCLLLALALRQSSPVLQIATDARLLQEEIEASSGKTTRFSDTGSVFAGRGLRRRIQDVGAAVDSRDYVSFDRPGYGQAVLTYVWDNYEIMRPRLLEWLVKASDASANDDPAINALAQLSFRFGGTKDLSDLRATALKTPQGDAVLGKVLAHNAHDEHTGRLVWATLYSWASQAPVQSVVVAMCRDVLRDPNATVPISKMAMVRLRRVVQEASNGPARDAVLEAWRTLATDLGRTDLLVDEIQKWQRKATQGTAGKLALLALMPLEHDGIPWLLSDEPPEIDVEAGLRDLFADPELLSETIPVVIDWVRTCAYDTSRYERLRDRLLSPLRDQKVFNAGMQLMQALADVRRPDGSSIGEDLYGRLGDPRLRAVFPLTESTS